MADTIDPSIVIETALLTSPVALKVEDLSRLFDGTLDADALYDALGRVASHWLERGLRLKETESGWRFQSAAEIAPYLAKLTEEKPAKYSRAVLETLAIIAYRQPATRGDIEEIRGVTVNPNVIRQLEERGWIEVIGHRESPGRPALFATTGLFLDDLGLKSLADLPALKGEEPKGEEFELFANEFADKIPAKEASNEEEDATASEVLPSEAESLEETEPQSETK